METAKSSSKLYLLLPLFILPMRNGNYENDWNSLKDLIAFYPTYEEWKHAINSASYRNLPLFILPMRNGNIMRER